MDKVRWSDLPEELVDSIANRSSSNFELLRIRSVCKPWRSAVPTKKRFLNRFHQNLPLFKNKKTFVFPTTFSRLTLPSSSCPNKGWLIKTRQVSESSKANLLSPLSSQLITPFNQTLDLLKFGISEIRQSYAYNLCDPNRKPFNTSRVLVVDNLIFILGYSKQIWCCNSEEKSSIWTRIQNKDIGSFSDIIHHRGQIYALDLKGSIWWISLPKLNIFQYRSSTPMEYNEIGYCKDMRLVEFCGDLCIVHRFCMICRVKRIDIERTVGFKVYKMDEELVKWVQVKSLGDKALIVAKDNCFTVLASEYYGCLENAIYFTDEDHGYKSIKGIKGEGVKVLKLDDGSIISMIDSSSQSCFQMFSLPSL